MAVTTSKKSSRLDFSKAIDDNVKPAQEEGRGETPTPKVPSVAVHKNEGSTVKKKYSKKEDRISLIVPPHIKEFLNTQKEEGYIKSANALINELLEEYMIKNI